MKARVLLIGMISLLALLATAWAADVAGKWVAQVPGRQGAMTENTFNFKVDGAALTGTLTTPQGETALSDGKVSGDDISFTVVRKFGENEMKILYKGKVAGDEIKFTREFQMPAGGPGGPGGGPGAGGPPGGGMGGPPPEIVAKRVK